MNKFPMSNFTVGLAIIGGLLLAVLVAWNAWSSRRNTPKQAQPETPAPAAEGTGDGTAERSDPV